MARKGQKTPPEVRAKMRAAQQARWDANRERLREQCNGIHFGMKRTAATRKRMSLAHKGLPVPAQPAMPAWLKGLRAERDRLDGVIGAGDPWSRGIVADDGRFFKSIGEAAQALGVSYGSITNHLCGRMKTVGGHVLWRV